MTWTAILRYVTLNFKRNWLYCVTFILIFISFFFVEIAPSVPSKWEKMHTFRRNANYKWAKVEIKGIRFIVVAKTSIGNVGTIFFKHFKWWNSRRKSKGPHSCCLLCHTQTISQLDHTKVFFGMIECAQFYTRIQSIFNFVWKSTNWRIHLVIYRWFTVCCHIDLNCWALEMCIWKILNHFTHFCGQCESIYSTSTHFWSMIDAHRSRIQSSQAMNNISNEQTITTIISSYFQTILRNLSSSITFVNNIFF